MFRDIEATIKAAANFGSALMLLNYTEILGALSTGQLGVKSNASASFERGLSLMSWNGDKRYYCDFRVNMSEGAAAPTPRTPYEIFRCGLAHEYFVKGLAMVHNNPGDPNHCVPQDQGIGWIDHQGRRTLRFYTNAYYRDFREAFLAFQNEVRNNLATQKLFVQSIERVRGRTISEVAV